MEKDREEDKRDDKVHPPGERKFFVRGIGLAADAARGLLVHRQQAAVVLYATADRERRADGRKVRSGRSRPAPDR